MIKSCICDYYKAYRVTQSSQLIPGAALSAGVEESKYYGRLYVLCNADAILGSLIGEKIIMVFSFSADSISHMEDGVWSRYARGSN